jgi:hypothetical protein
MNRYTPSSSKDRPFNPQSGDQQAMRSPFAHSDASQRDPYHHARPYPHAHSDASQRDPYQHARPYPPYHRHSDPAPRNPSQLELSHRVHHSRPALQVLKRDENPYTSMTPAQISVRIEQFPLVSTEDVGLFDRHFRALMAAIMQLDENTSKGLTSHLVWTLVHARNRLGNCSLERVVTNDRVGLSVKINMAKFLMTITDDDAFNTTEGRTFRTYMGGWLQENQGALMHQDHTPPRDCDKWILTARRMYGAVAHVEPVLEEDDFTPGPPTRYPGETGSQKRLHSHKGQSAESALQKPHSSGRDRQTSRFDDTTIEQILQNQRRMEEELRLQVQEKKPKYDTETIDAIVQRQKVLEEELQMLRQKPAPQESQGTGFTFGARASDSHAIQDHLAAEEAAIEEAHSQQSGRTRITATPPKAGRGGRGGAKKKK